MTQVFIIRRHEVSAEIYVPGDQQRSRRINGKSLNNFCVLALLCLTLVGLQSVRAAGGLLLFTQNGSPYVTAVQYVSFTQPSTHLSTITTRDGKRVQIQTAGIVGQLPFPDANSPLSSADAETYTGMAGMLAARYPQYAKAIQETGEAWSRYAEKRRGEEEKAAKDKLEQERQAKIAEQQRLAQEERERLEKVAEEERLAKLEKDRLAQEAEKQRAAILEQQRLAKEATEKRIAQVEEERRQQEADRQRLAQQNHDQKSHQNEQSPVQKEKSPAPEQWYAPAINWLKWLGGEILGKAERPNNREQESQ